MLTKILTLYLILVMTMGAGEAQPDPAYSVDGVIFYTALKQGALVRGKLDKGSRLMLDGATVRVTGEGDFMIGFARDYQGPARLDITNPDGIKQVISVPVRSRDYAIEKINGLPPETVTPPPEWRERRAEENQRVKAARAFKSDRLDWQGDFIKPANGRYSGFYGSQRILNGKPRTPHYGLDIAAPKGEPVKAPLGGVVRLAAPDFLLEGGIVIIDHGYDLSSTLFHMEDVLVEEGQYVKRGQLIGKMGAKGRASGSHVDWRINWGRVRLDPALSLPLEDQPEISKK